MSRRRGGRASTVWPSFDVIQRKEVFMKLSLFHSAKEPRSLLKVEGRKLRSTRPGRKVCLEDEKGEANGSVRE